MAHSMTAACNALKALRDAMLGPEGRDERIFQWDLVHDQVEAIESLLLGGEFASKLCRANGRFGPIRTVPDGDEVQKMLSSGRSLFADRLILGPQGFLRKAASEIENNLPTPWRPKLAHPVGIWARGVIGASYEFHKKLKGRWTPVHTDRFYESDGEVQSWVAIWPLDGDLLVLTGAPCTDAGKLHALGDKNLCMGMLREFFADADTKAMYVPRGQCIFISKDVPHGILSLTDVVQASWSEWAR